MNNELLGVRVIGGGGLEAAHKGAVAQLGLGVGAYQLQAQGLGQPLRLLIRAGLRQQRGYEHLHAEDV